MGSQIITFYSLIDLTINHTTSTDGLKPELAARLLEAKLEEEQRAARRAKRKANQISAEFHTSEVECLVCLEMLNDEIFSCRKGGHSICGEQSIACR